MRRRTAALVALAVALIAALYAAHQELEREMTRPGPTTQPVRIEVQPGATVRNVLGRLATLGVVRDARHAELYLRMRGRQLNIKAGHYEIPPHASPSEVFDLLEQGRVVLEQLTIVEGSTFADFRRALEQHPAVAATLRGNSDAEVMIAIGRGGEHPEGRFFPDTYRFAAKTTDVELLKLAYGRMQQVLADAWARRRDDLPVRTAYEALILASIVEKETALASERPRIAGVFTTRLRRGMRLQSDPTIIYGLGSKYDGDIRSRDLITDTPYNTYTRPGLPPTPIALPGRESVLAAVHPAETGALYFVATGKGDGSHYFSATLQEHNAAVQRYLARLKRQSATDARPAPSEATR